MQAGPFSGAKRRARGKRHRLKHEILCEHQETLFYCQGDRAREQVAQRGGGVSICGDFQNLMGHSPEQPALAGPAWAGELAKMISRGKFQYQLFSATLNFHK